MRPYTLLGHWWDAPVALGLSFAVCLPLWLLLGRPCLLCLLGTVLLVVVASWCVAGVFWVRSLEPGLSHVGLLLAVAGSGPLALRRGEPAAWAWALVVSPFVFLVVLGCVLLSMLASIS